MPISSAGIGSNLDVNAIITQLMALEQRPLTSLQNKASQITTKISAFGQIKSQLAGLGDAIGKLSSSALWSSKTATSSQPLAVGVTATGTAQATAFGLDVKQLATAQSAASAKVATNALFAGGTLTLQIGQWKLDNPGTVASPGDPAGPRSFDVSGASKSTQLLIAAGASLADVASQINGSDAGVSATVVSDGNGQQQLLMRSKATGEVNGFQLQAADGGTPGPGEVALSGLIPAGGIDPIYAKNALAKINGIAITSASNTLADTVPGLSLSLLKVTEAGVPADITIGRDNAAIQTAVTAFVAAYNATNTLIAQATKYDAATKQSALLQGDSTTTGLQRTLRRMVGALGGGAGPINSLSDIGISFGKSADGSLSLDSEKLTKALASDPQAVRALFIAPDDGAGGASSAKQPVGAQLKAFLDSMTGGGGVLASKSTSLQTQQRANERDQSRVQDRLASTEERLRKQYSALDTIVANSTALNAYITQQIAQWNRPSQ